MHLDIETEIRINEAVVAIYMTTTITVEGMSCEHCEQTIEEALRGVAGVSDAHADRETEAATVEGEPDTAALVQAIENAGYTAHT